MNCNIQVKIFLIHFFEQKGGPLSNKNKKSLFSKMTIDTPIESPCRIYSKYVVTKNIRRFATVKFVLKPFLANPRQSVPNRSSTFLRILMYLKAKINASKTVRNAFKNLAKRIKDIS
jgi:hypothetical protein